MVLPLNNTLHDIRGAFQLFGAKDGFKQIGQAGKDFFSTVSGKIMGVTAAVLALYGAWKLVDNAFNITFEAVQKDLDAANEKFGEAKPSQLI